MTQLTTTKPEIHTVIIGAGGVTSYFLPAFMKTFEGSILLVDGDILEDRNLDRQLFDNRHVGKNKAAALANKYKSKRIVVLEEYLSDWNMEKAQPSGVHLVVVAVDNHSARRRGIKLAEELFCPVLVLGNEYETSQAMLDLSPAESWIYEIYPEILTDTEDDPTNPSCTGEDAESTPQLAMANQTAAALGNNLLWKWFKFGPESGMIEPITALHSYGYLPIEYRTTLGKVMTRTYEELENERKEKRELCPV